MHRRASRFRFAFLAAAVLTQATALHALDWIDVKTGKRVADWPSIGGRVIRGMNRDSAFDPETGRNFGRDECGNWIDVKTGKRVADWPSIGGRVIRGMNRNSAFDPETGRNFARECPPTRTAGKQPQSPPPTGGSVGQAPVLDKVSEQILATHNRVRAEVGSPPLHWDPALAAAASAYAAQLANGAPFVHAPRAGREKQRENLSRGLPGASAEQMMVNWTREKQDFKLGIYPDISKTNKWYNTSHYTQMIWSTTTDLGCGVAQGVAGAALVCRYSPPGNIDGKPVLVDIPIAFKPGFVVGSARVGLDVNVCSGKGASGAGNDVNQQGSMNAVVDALLKCEGSVETAVQPPELPKKEVFKPEKLGKLEDPM